MIFGKLVNLFQPSFSYGWQIDHSPWIEAVIIVHFAIRYHNGSLNETVSTTTMNAQLLTFEHEEELEVLGFSRNIYGKLVTLTERLKLSIEDYTAGEYRLNNEQKRTLL